MRINTFLTGQLPYVVVGPVAAVKIIGGGERYVFRNSHVPADASPDHIEHLLRTGLIEPLTAESEDR